MVLLILKPCQFWPCGRSRDKVKGYTFYEHNNSMESIMIETRNSVLARIYLQSGGNIIRTCLGT